MLPGCPIVRIHPDQSPQPVKRDENEFNDPLDGPENKAYGFHAQLILSVKLGVEVEISVVLGRSALRTTHPCSVTAKQPPLAPGTSSTPPELQVLQRQI